MIADADSQATEALSQIQRYMSAVEDQRYRAEAETFTATDESGTVTVTVNGDRWLTDLRIEHGLLRLGAGTVQLRLLEALRKAQASAFEVASDQVQQLDGMLAGMVNVIQEQLGDLQPPIQ